MRRSTWIKSIWAGVGLAVLVVAFLWSAGRTRYNPPVDISPPPVTPPVHRPDSILINHDTAQPVAGIPAAPDQTVTRAMPETHPADTTPRLLPGPDTAVIPADADMLIEPGKLIIPVAGIRANQLQDTYNDARSEGRVHNAIDIMAAGGTPVLAATGGKIVKLFQSELGGTTIYELDPNNRVIYYYAHLARYADGLAEGQTVHQGDVIAYVGDTGNAGPGNYHLHFEISIIQDPRQYWGGTPVNPYPILREAGK